ncbi:MAG TPA: PIN domain-containing protein [Thermoanaerobaculia bacterium]
MKRTSRPLARWSGKKLLVDTNILLLYIVGSLSPDHIARHKRTDTFTVEDYRLLDRLLRQFSGIVVTPNILTEVSNLLGYTDAKTREKLLLLLRAWMPAFDEHYVRSHEAVELTEFPRLGLADASVLACMSQGLTILTDDLHLYLALQRKGGEVINFNHLREATWQEE